MSKYYLNQNSKLKEENIYKFSLPVLITCIMAGICKAFCYARHGFYAIFKKSIAKSHKRNLDFSKTKFFVNSISQEIKKRKIKTLRIHDSGDFYSQVYVNKWFRIAKQNTHTFFYCYTKSLHLDFSKFDSLFNTKVIQSFGGKLDNLIDINKPHCKIFDDSKTLLRQGYFDCTKSDLLAIKHVRIGLVKH